MILDNKMMLKKKVLQKIIFDILIYTYVFLNVYARIVWCFFQETQEATERNVQRVRRKAG